MTYCFIVAYGTNRTLLLANDGQSWSYSRSGWESVFLPVSSCSYKKVIRVWFSLKWVFSKPALKVVCVLGALRSGER